MCYVVFDMYMEFVGFVFVACLLHEMCLCMVAEYSLLSLFVRNMYDFCQFEASQACSLDLIA